MAVHKQELCFSPSYSALLPQYLSGWKQVLFPFHVGYFFRDSSSALEKGLYLGRDVTGSGFEADRRVMCLTASTYYESKEGITL